MCIESKTRMGRFLSTFYRFLWIFFLGCVLLQTRPKGLEIQNGLEILRSKVHAGTVGNVSTEAVYSYKGINSRFSNVQNRVL